MRPVFHTLATARISPFPHLPITQWRIWLVILPVVFLVPMGFLQRALFDDIHNASGNPANTFAHHIGILAVGAGLFSAVLWIGARRLGRHTLLLYCGTLVLLTLTLVPGISQHVNGARRWLALGPLRFQPSTLLAITIPLVAAFGLTTPNRTYFSPARVLPFLILLCVPLFLQPSFGTASVSFVLIFLMSMLGKTDRRLLISISVVFVVLVAFLLLNTPNRLRRITLWLPGGESYQQSQGLAALASGGLTGQGVGAARHVQGYLPEWHTDFNYAIIGEEWGAITCIGIALLFTLPVLATFTFRKYTSDSDASLAMGVAFSLTLQAYVHFAVNVGLLPVAGTQLPLVSAGGSHFIADLVSVALILSILHGSGHSPEPAGDGSASMLARQFISQSLIACFGLLSFRVIFLCVDDERRSNSPAYKQSSTVIATDRGTIWAHNGSSYIPVAYSQPTYTVGIDPHFNYNSNPSRTAINIALLTDIPVEEVKQFLVPYYRSKSGLDPSSANPPDPTDEGAPGSPIKWKRLLASASVSQVARLDYAKRHWESEDRRTIRGLYYRTTARRIYPYAPFASSLLGYVNFDGYAVTGIERTYDFHLKPSHGFVLSSRDGRGIPLAWSTTRIVEPQSGRDIYLFLDAAWQRRIEAMLGSIAQRNNPMACSAIVVSTDSRQVLACASWPTYNSNEYNRISYEERDRYMDRAQMSLIGIGPMARVFLGAISNELALASQQSRSARTPPPSEMDALWANREFVLENLRQFGLLDRSVSDLPDRIRPMTEWRRESDLDLRMLTALRDFGVGLAVTPIHLASAVATLHSGGIWNRLRFVEKIGDVPGSTYDHERLDVITPQSAKYGLARIEDKSHFYFERNIGSFIYQTHAFKAMPDKPFHSTIAGAFTENSQGKVSIIVTIWDASGAGFFLRDELNKLVNKF